jgi:hypothetical protein
MAILNLPLPEHLQERPRLRSCRVKDASSSPERYCVLDALPSKPTALDQAIYGTCVAVSTLYILRCLSMLQGSPAFREHLSIPMLHYNGLLERLRWEGVSLDSYLPRFVSSDEGNALVWVVEGLNSMGCVLDWMYPYSTSDMQSTAAPGYMDEPPGHTRLLCRLSKLFLPTVHYYPIINQGHMETSLSSSSSPSGIILGALATLKLPLIIVMGFPYLVEGYELLSHLCTYEKGGRTYHCVQGLGPEDDVKFAGAHQMVLVGYDSQLQMAKGSPPGDGLGIIEARWQSPGGFEFVSSWGELYGDKGHAWVSFDTVDHLFSLRALEVWAVSTSQLHQLHGGKD